MILYPDIHLATTGDHIAADGSSAPLVREDFEELVMSHDNLRHNPPLVLGHSGDDPNRIPKNDSQPRFGFPVRLYIVDDPKTGESKLYGDLKIHPILANLIEEGAYYARSISFYPSDSLINPTPGVKSLRHIAFLGATPPAIKGLEDIVKFNEGDCEPMTTKPTKEEQLKKKEEEKDMGEQNKKQLKNLEPTQKAIKDPENIVALQEDKEMGEQNKEQLADMPPTQEPEADKVVAFQEDEEAENNMDVLAKNAESMISAILRNGESGFDGEIISFDPSPTAENGFLAEDGVIQGKFIDERGEVFEFIIDTEAGQKSFKPVSETQEGEEQPDAEEEMGEGKMMEDDKEMEMGEGKLLAKKQLGEGMPEYLQEKAMMREPCMEDKGEMPEDMPEEFREDPRITHGRIHDVIANKIEAANTEVGPTRSSAETEASSMLNSAKRAVAAELEAAKEDKIRMMEKQITSLTEALARTRETQLREYAETCYSEGILSQGSVPKKDFMALVNMLEKNSQQVVSFSEGENTVEGTPLEAFQKFVAGLPKAVHFGEFDTSVTDYSEKSKSASKPAAVNATARGYEKTHFNPDSSQVHQLAVEYCESQKWSRYNPHQYMEAVKIVNRSLKNQ